MRQFVARVSGANCSFSHAIERGFEASVFVVFDVKQGTKLRAVVFFARGEGRAHVHHIEQLLAAARVAIITEEIQITACVAAEQLAKLPVMARQQLRPDT